MKDIKWKAVVFTMNGDLKNGHYFYNVTLHEALLLMAVKGLDPVKNIKMNIAVYPW